MAELKEWLYNFYYAWNLSCSHLTEKEGAEVYKKLNKLLEIISELKEDPFDERECRGIFSMGLYWKEVLRREESQQKRILSAELNQLEHFLKARRVLLAVFASAKLQTVDAE